MKRNTLENYWIDDAVNGKILEQTEILREITEYFEGIHSEGKVYGELSPSCVILDEKRKLSIKSNDILANKSLSEWRPADERDDANSKLKPTKEGDIFNLGCFFYYIITGGQHPFGRSGQRISFIANNLYDLSGCRDELLQKLINRMISHDSTKRPTSSNLIRHPYLWKKEKIEEYIYMIAEHFDEASNQYLKLKDNFLLPSSQSSSVMSVAEIMAEIKGKQETPLNACNTFPDFLSSVYLTFDPDGEIQKETNDQSCPIIFKNLLIANDCFGVVGPFKLRHGRFGLQPVHVMEFPQTSTEFSEPFFLMKRLACLNHPNLLKYFYVGEKSDENSSKRSIILAGEPFDETLETLVKKKNSLDFETAKDILNQITSGLLEYHSNNLVHGDVTSSQIAIFNKSENIIAKLAKFPINDEIEMPSMQNDIRKLGQIYFDIFKQVKDVPPLCSHLIQSLKCVPQCETIFYHPLFWSSEGIAEFLLVAGDFYKGNPNIDRISILEQNHQNWKSKHEFQHLKTNRSAIEYFLTQTSSDLATVALAVELTKQYPMLVIQTWLKLQKFKSMDCGLNLDPFYCPTYDFLTFEELRDDGKHPLKGAVFPFDSIIDQKNKPEEKLCQEIVTPSHDEDEGYDSVSTTSSQSEPEFIMDQFSISNPAERQLNKWNAEIHPIQHYLSNYVHQWEVAEKDHPKKIMKHPVIDPFGRTAMHLACHSDDFYVLAVRLVELGSNPDTRDKNGYAPLHVAAETKATQITELLIEKKVTIDICANNSMTPLFFAAISNSPSTIKLLIKNKADVTKVDNFGRSPLHFAVATNSLENVGLLLKPLKKNIGNLCEIVDAVDQDGMSPLHIAVANNSIVMVERLLKEYRANPNVGKVDGPELSVQKMEKMRPVLQLAVELKLYGVIDLLLQNGADPDLTDIHGKTSLHVAALLIPPCPDRLKIVERLITNKEKRANVNAVDKMGRTVLHVAILNEAEDVVKRLLECQTHIEIDKKEREREITPLHLAAWKNLENITGMLINQGKARVDARDRNGDTPLEYAASSNAVEVAKQLLEAGVLAKCKRWNGRSPLHVAAAHNAQEVAELLISKEADVNAKDDLGLTPLHYAEYCGMEKFAEFLIHPTKDNHPACTVDPPSKKLTPAQLKSVRLLTNGFTQNIPSKIRIMLPPMVAQFNEFKLQVTQGLIIEGFQSN